MHSESYFFVTGTTNMTYTKDLLWNVDSSVSSEARTANVTGYAAMYIRAA